MGIPDGSSARERFDFFSSCSLHDSDSLWNFWRIGTIDAIARITLRTFLFDGLRQIRLRAGGDSALQVDAAHSG